MTGSGPGSGWNFADVYEAVAARIPDAPCQVQGDRVVTWREFDQRANALAADLVDAGLGHQAKVAAYLYNGPEYLETYVAAFKAGMAPVNTNYRYGPEEIRYLFDNADAEAVVFHASFAPLLEEVRASLPAVRRWYVVAEEGVESPSWAVDYDGVVGSGAEAPPSTAWGRSGDDLLLLYTGGTTGMPKGVMWRQDDLFHVLGRGGNALLGVAPADSVDELASRISGPGPVMLPACPLMHGTGQFSSFIAMNAGGCIVVLDGRSFSPEALWATVERRKVNSVVIVGDAFAKPLLAALEAAGEGAWDLSSVGMISSSGVMWSQETKEGLLRHLPGAVLFDSFGSSEAVGMGGSVSAAGTAVETAKFTLGERVQVFTDDGRRVAPGSGEVGMVAVGGWIPLGYYKDSAKTEATFRTIDGQRWSIPGDFASVNEDGSLHLLGRGSVCINTGGEKVFPEEVEEVLKTHPSVRDAVCVGLPDDRFGEVICAVVEPAGGSAPAVDETELIEHVRGRLARYKAPRSVVVVDSIGRSPAGKVDYKGVKARALEVAQRLS
jgi:3-oxocholest-4-en-26-oate---CoA ligase